MEWIYLFCGLLAGACIVFFIRKTEKAPEGVAPEKYADLDRQHSAAQERGRLQEEEIKRLREALAQESRLSRELEQELTRSRELLELQKQSLREREELLRQQKEEFNRMQAQTATQFENIAGRLLEEKSKKFTELNKTSIDHLLTPLRENIKSFEEKVEKAYKAESDERNVLKGTVQQMMKLNQQLSEDTNNLTRALRGDSKKQGNWGEVILSRILERSGLVEGENYVLQAKNLKLENEEGRRLQPDVIVQLPGNKHIVIDAKVSLTAYERMVSSESEEERQRHLKQHVQSVRAHMNGLSSKDYASLQGINAPDFVILFMPIESSFSVAVQQDTSLFADAWDQKIVVVGPSTLLATLLTIAATWKQEKQNRNAQEIAGRAGRLYDKFAGFVEDLEKLGKQLDTTQKVYDSALGKLHSGRGNLLNQTEELRKLGAKNTKRLNDRYLDED